VSGKKEKEKVIKPPMERITSGKIFKPAKAMRNKMWLQAIVLLYLFWLAVIVSAFGIGYIVLVLDQGRTFAYYVVVMSDLWMHINFWFLVIDAFWFVPLIIVIPIYINRIFYSVIAESGETMPEVYVKKGIITITEKHVPFRTITNISSKSGPFDRLFRIGSVWIQTAGFSGGAAGGSSPEEKLEGIVFFEEVRDFILRELRKFRDPYVTGTEVVLPREDSEINRAGFWKC
jgi:membrane protein YdbS with pleckstrin-like domain